MRVPLLRRRAHRVCADEDVLFGGEAMLDRVVSLLPAPSCRSRSPAEGEEDSAPVAAATGLERAARQGSRHRRGRLRRPARVPQRRGPARVRRAAGARASSRPMRFHFFGRDTDTYFGSSARAYFAADLRGAPRRLALTITSRKRAGLAPPAHGPLRLPLAVRKLRERAARGPRARHPVLASRHGCMPGSAAAST